MAPSKRGMKQRHELDHRKSHTDTELSLPDQTRPLQDQRGIPRSSMGTAAHPKKLPLKKKEQIGAEVAPTDQPSSRTPSTGPNGARKRAPSTSSDKHKKTRKLKKSKKWINGDTGNIQGDDKLDGQLRYRLNVTVPTCEVSQEELEQFFGDYNFETIEWSKTSPGIAYVYFASLQQAYDAMQALHGQRINEAKVFILMRSYDESQGMPVPLSNFVKGQKQTGYSATSVSATPEDRITKKKKKKKTKIEKKNAKDEEPRPFDSPGDGEPEEIIIMSGADGAENVSKSQRKTAKKENKIVHLNDEDAVSLKIGWEDPQVKGSDMTSQEKPKRQNTFAAEKLVSVKPNGNRRKTKKIKVEEVECPQRDKVREMRLSSNEQCENHSKERMPIPHVDSIVGGQKKQQWQNRFAPKGMHPARQTDPGIRNLSKPIAIPPLGNSNNGFGPPVTKSKV
jgi:hypothetical protein